MYHYHCLTSDDDDDDYNADTLSSGSVVFPVDFFEHCSVMNDIEYGGNDLLQVYNVQQLKNRLNSQGNIHEMYQWWMDDDYEGENINTLQVYLSKYILYNVTYKGFVQHILLIASGKSWWNIYVI